MGLPVSTFAWPRPAVLKSGRVAFDPPLSADLQRDIQGLNVAHMAKIVLEVEPQFFTEKGVPENMHMDLPEAKPSLFCHLHGAGKPLITTERVSR